MKKSILNIGKALSKADQKQIQGGEGPFGSGCPTSDGYNGQSCNTTADCPPNPIPQAPYMCDFGCCLYAY